VTRRPCAIDALRVADLFGRHVSGEPTRGRRGETFVAPEPGTASDCNAEIGDLHEGSPWGLRSEQDLEGLKVPMDDPFACASATASHPAHVADGFGHREGRRARARRFEICSVPGIPSPGTARRARRTDVHPRATCGLLRRASTCPSRTKRRRFLAAQRFDAKKLERDEWSSCK